MLQVGNPECFADLCKSGMQISDLRMRWPANECWDQDLIRFVLGFDAGVFLVNCGLAELPGRAPRYVDVRVDSYLHALLTMHLHCSGFGVGYIQRDIER